MTHPKLILASMSNTRLRIIKTAGLDITAVAPAISEEILHAEIINQNPQTQAEYLATAKAMSLCANHPGIYIIGCDQILSCKGEIYHKAKTRVEAETTLKNLRGKTHILNNAITLVKDGNIISKFTSVAELTMRNFTDKFLNDYLDKSMPDILSSVGCYFYEGSGIQLFEKTSGDTYTIQGLPLLPLLEVLRKHSIIAS